MTSFSRLLLATLLVGALVAAPGASAIYIVTPVKIQVSDDTPNVGDTVTLTIVRDPEYNDPNVSSLAGKTLIVKYNLDPQEGEENSEPPADGEAKATFREIGTVTLDDKESATLTWTIPQELDDHNAFLTAVDGEGNDVGVGHGPVAVGDAPPIMMIMRNSPSDGAPEPQPEPTGVVDEEAQGNLDDAPPADTSGESAADDAKENATPAIGLAAFVAIAAIAALVVRKRR